MELVNLEKKKLSELERLQLENISLKLIQIQSQTIFLRQETQMLQLEKEKLFKTFAEANGMTVSQMSIDIPTGEVTILEDKKEA